MNKSKKIASVAFLLTVSLILTTSTSDAQVEEQEQVENPAIYKLVGRVVDASNGEAIQNVKIQIEQANQQTTGEAETETQTETEMGINIGENMTTTTNERGQFSFEKLPGGQLTIRINHNGYDTWERNVNLNQDSQLTIELQPNR